MDYRQHFAEQMNYCAVYTSTPDKHQYFITWEIICNLFLWCLCRLIKLKAAVSGQRPPTSSDEASRHISFRNETRGGREIPGWRVASHLLFKIVSYCVRRRSRVYVAINNAHLKPKCERASRGSLSLDRAAPHTHPARACVPSFSDRVRGIIS